MFADDFIVLKIDVDEMAHGDETAKKLRGAGTGGIPWITILDGDGVELVTSDGPDGNIGCPMSEDERGYFVSMIKQTVQHSPDARIDELAKALEVFASK